MKQCTRDCSSCIKAIAHGYARKISLVFLLLSFCGYLVFIGGLSGHATLVDLSSQAARFLFLPYWGVVVFGPVTYILAILHIALSDRYIFLGIILECITTFFYMGYAITISAPFIVSALFIFGASGFGDFTRFANDLVPLPSIQQILGLDSDFLDVVIGLIQTLYELMQEGVEKVVDLVLKLPSGSQFTSSMGSQFAGCCITLFFLACSIALWPFYSTKEELQVTVRANRDLTKK